MLLWSSSQVIINNFRYINVIKTGKIIGIEYVDGSTDNIKGTYNNKILIEAENKIVYGGTQKAYSIGDIAKLRYTGKVPSNIFEINGQKISSKYDIWDWLSPILFLFCGFMLFMYIKMWISNLKNNIMKK